MLIKLMSWDENARQSHDILIDNSSSERVEEFKYLGITLLTYSPTPWSRVLLEKLTGFHLVKKFPEFHGMQRFITTFTSVCHLSLS